MSTPSVLGISAPTATSAVLVGQVLPSGSVSTATFSYWNQATPQTVLSAPVSVPAGYTPVVVQAAVIGLASGATYLFQLTYAGLTSSTLSFVAAPPASAAPVATASLVSIPHMTYPLTMSALHGVETCEQNSDSDVTSCVMAVLSCTPGEYPEVPSFGIPNLAFSQVPPPAERLAGAVLQWETRATIDTVTQMINDGSTGTWGVGLTVTPQTS